MLQAKVSLTCANTRQFIMETGSGHHLIVDDSIGKTGPKPVELVAGALAGCTAFDVITVLRSKKHKNVTGYEVSVEADQAQTPPQVFTQVRVHHKITGSDVDPGSVEDAIALSEEKYCAVAAMLRQSGAEITTNPGSVEDAIALSEEKYCAVAAMLRQSGAEITTTYSIHDNSGVLITTTRHEEPAVA